MQFDGQSIINFIFVVHAEVIISCMFIMAIISTNELN
jgi:hypothetical protein